MKKIILICFTLIFAYSSNAQITIGIPGCTDSNSTNYNPIATFDDGSCERIITPLIFGCTDPAALNYNPLANRDNGNCLYDINSIEEESATNSVFIYPNPIEGNQLFINGTVDNVIITDLNGLEILNLTISTDTINMDGLPDGSYIVSLYKEGELQKKELLFK